MVFTQKRNQRVRQGYQISEVNYYPLSVVFSTDPKVQWRPQAESGTLDDLMPWAGSGILRGGETKPYCFLA